LNIMNTLRERKSQQTHTVAGIRASENEHPIKKIRHRRSVRTDALHLLRCAALAVVGYSFVPRALHLQHPERTPLSLAGLFTCLVGGPFIGFRLKSLHDRT